MSVCLSVCFEKLGGHLKGCLQASLCARLPGVPSTTTKKSVYRLQDYTYARGIVPRILQMLTCLLELLTCNSIPRYIIPAERSCWLIDYYILARRKGNPEGGGEKKRRKFLGFIMLLSRQVGKRERERRDAMPYYYMDILISGEMKSSFKAFGGFFFCIFSSVQILPRLVDKNEKV